MGNDTRYSNHSGIGQRTLLGAECEKIYDSLITLINNTKELRPTESGLELSISGTNYSRIEMIRQRKKQLPSTIEVAGKKQYRRVVKEDGLATVKYVTRKPKKVQTLKDIQKMFK
jgi:hypothetical protein